MRKLRLREVVSYLWLYSEYVTVGGLELRSVLLLSLGLSRS